MDIIDKVSIVADEQNWCTHYLKQVDEMVDSPSETYPKSFRYCLKWQVPFAAAVLRQPQHPVLVQSVPQDGQRGRLEGHEGEDVAAEPKDPSAAEDMGLGEKTTN